MNSENARDAINGSPQDWFRQALVLVRPIESRREYGRRRSSRAAPMIGERPLRIVTDQCFSSRLHVVDGYCGIVRERSSGGLRWIPAGDWPVRQRATTNGARLAFLRGDGPGRIASDRDIRRSTPSGHLQEPQQ
jgi:hypothetical protein